MALKSNNRQNLNQNSINQDIRTYMPGFLWAAEGPIVSQTAIDGKYVMSLNGKLSTVKLTLSLLNSIKDSLTREYETKIDKTMHNSQNSRSV